ncbi:MAG: beta strand repeat-containing protein [Paludibacter sp.]
MNTSTTYKILKPTKIFFAAVLEFMLVELRTFKTNLSPNVKSIKYYLLPKMAFVSLILLLWIPNLANGQSILVSPSGDGGFETGTSFGANGWISVNDGSNYWVVGTATKYSGINAAYISNDGSNNTYTNSTNNTSHFYRDITVPAGESNINLSFYLQGTGELTYDRLLIYTAPTSVTPTAGNPVEYTTNIPGATLIYDQPTLLSSYTLQSITLPGSLNGTTFRLIFTWQNDNNTGTNPPASVDNISLTSSVQTNFTTSGTSTFTVPSGITLLQVEAWGGGGKGGTRSNNGVGGGGGGGAYSRSFLSVTPGNTYNISVGGSGTSTSTTAVPGGDSYFKDATTLLAKGGNTVAYNTASGATGGAAASGIGDYKTSGGNGANGSPGNYGGGGGSSAGTTSNGNTATNATGATAPSGGGAGGNGRSGSQGNGTAGTAPGGGGGGGYRTSSGTRTGGSGANGQVIVSWPTINVSTGNLTGFTYPVGYGPSSEQSFTVSGTTLTTNIYINATDSFEISLTSGTSFVPQTKLTILVNNGTVTTTTVYVRMKAGLPVGTVAVNKISCTSDYAITQLVNCSGTVSDVPVITFTPTTLSGFGYNVTTGGPSTGQSFTVGGINLGTSNLVVTPPADYEISTAQNGTYQSTPFTYIPSSGTVTAQTIWVRLRGSLSSNTYNETLTASVTTSTATITQNLALNGSVNQPTISVSVFTLGGFIYTLGAGPSGFQSFTVNGQYLGTNNLVLTAPTNFEVSQTSGSGYGPTVTLIPSSGTVATTTIYVRLKSLLGVNTYGPSNLTAISTGAIQQNVILSGAVVNTATATSISSNNTLVGFVYTLGSPPSSGGPSVVQSFTVSGTSLTGNITVTAPTNFEVSSDGSTWVSSFTITPSGGLVNAALVYIRMKAGLTIVSPGPNYSGNITLASSGAATQNVSCSGVVIAVPTITAGPAGLESTCSGANITLTSTAGSGTTGISWTGPNGWTSTDPNPALGVVTSANNGSYTVTGSTLSGVNLLTNAGFESGPTGFGSTYTLDTYEPQSAQNTYNIGPNPSIKNAAFCNQTGGHTGTNQMFIDGATPTSGGIGSIVWSESVSVATGANYQFTFYVQSLVSTSPAVLQLYVNGVPVGTPYTAPSYACLPWVQFPPVYVNSGSSNVLQLALVDLNTVANGNDFALDDMMFQQAFPVSSSVNLIANTTLPVSVGIAASVNPLYSGGSVTFTATPVNGGVAPLYQWIVNGSNVGTNSSSSTFVYTPAAGDIITCQLTSNYPCTTGNPATSNPLTATARNNFWYGGTLNKETDWNTAANWTGGFIPAPGNDVEYASTTNAYLSDAVADLNLDQNRTIGSLINKTTRRLVIPAGKGLIVNNSITTDNNVDRIYIYSSSSAPNGSLEFHNPQYTPVYASVEMYSIANITALASPNKYNWQYFGSPLSSLIAHPTLDNSYIRGWHENGTTISNHWISLTNDSILRPFYGYEICQAAPKTFLFQGALVNSDFNSGALTISYFGAGNSSNALFPGQYVFANPYTAAIDIRKLSFGSGAEATVYIYNTGSFGSWTSIGGTASADSTTFSPGQYIAVPKLNAGYAMLPRQVPSMQAFLIRPLTPTSTDYNLSIAYNSVVMRNFAIQRVPSETVSASDKVGTIIDVKGANATDRMWIFSEPTSTYGFDNGWDGQKIIGSALTPQIYAIEKDGNYQINTVPDINNTELAFQAGQDVEDTLTFTNMNLEKQYAGVYLVDLLENRTIDITTSGTQYAFMAESTPTPVTRFKIVTRPYEKNAPDAETQVKVFSAGNSIYVQNVGSADGECRVYDIA